jgi:hypothetical protein
MKNLLNHSVMSSSNAFPQEALATNYEVSLSIFHKVDALNQGWPWPFI